jgi:hypothetical protein
MKIGEVIGSWQDRSETEQNKVQAVLVARGLQGYKKVQI